MFPASSFFSKKGKVFPKTDLGVESLLDGSSSLDLRFSSINLRHDPVNVLQFMAAFPKYCTVLHNFLGSFTCTK